MRRRIVAGILLSAACHVSCVQAEPVGYWQLADSKEQEDYVRVPMPPGVQVVITELEGPVFAAANGHTLYAWPLKDLRNGDLGDRKASVSTCTSEVFKVTSGLMSPYPAGLVLPEVDKRPSCARLWPPFQAADDAKPIGKWTVTTRADGAKQWAYDGLPVYTSILDQKPGDVWGGTKLQDANDAPVVRVPIAPPSQTPPEFMVVAFSAGRMLTTRKGFAVYTSDQERNGKPNCNAACLKNWTPVFAPATARPLGEWTIVEAALGIRQWAFRGRPLYTYNLDPRTRGVLGSDEPGWHNVYTQRALTPPGEFTVQDSRLGQVLADSRGRTIYLYNCSDDAMDQLACDHPQAPQEYRMAICGNGDPKLCNQTFPYVTASADTKGASKLWSVMAIDPNTGRRAAAGVAGAVNVWAYRDRPVYTYGGDREAGDTNGDGYGEFNGYRNGFKAFWLRDDFRNNAMVR